jgi:hypothetical protein
MIPSTPKIYQRPGLAAILVIVAAALLYFFTLDNGLRPDELTGGDLITHQYAQVEGRPSNAPGYPLYTIGGWLWFRLGTAILGWTLNPVQILSLYSVGWALVSLVVLYLILWQVTGQKRPIAGLLTAFYATTYFFWYYAITTEQYTSAVFQTLLVIWLAFKWDEFPQDVWLLWLAVVLGTMLANMLTTLFILLPLLWFLFSKKDPTGSRNLSDLYHKPKLTLKVIGLALLPLLSYAYIYIRGAQHPEWRGSGHWSSTWAWFVQFLMVQQGRDELAPGLTLSNFFTAEFPALLWQELTWFIFLGGLLGLAALGQRRAIFLYSTLAIYLVFCWAYRFGNWFQVIIPAYPIFIIGAAAGLNRISAWRMPAGYNIANGRFLSAHSLIRSLIFLLLVILLVYQFAANLPRANQHNRPDDTGLNPGWAILADRPAFPALVVADFAERVALQYLTTVWGLAPGLKPINPADIDGPPTSYFYITRQAAATVPQIIQLTQTPPQAAGEQLILLQSPPLIQLPSGATPLNLAFGDALKLVGYELVEAEILWPDSTIQPLGRGNWQIALYWQALQPPGRNYTISVRPMQAGQLITHHGQPVIQDHPPVWGVYPTGQWQPGPLVRDIYALNLPSGVTPDAVQIVVYRPTDSGFENLTQHTFPLP